MKKINFLLLAIALPSLLIQSCVETPKYEEPKQLISTDVARLLNSNYIDSRHRLISNSIQKEDANSAWYSIEELENYINYAKNKGKEKGYTVDGIRIYLGSYSNNPDEHNEKANMTTVFLVPTGKRNDVQKGGILNLPAATSLKEDNLDIEEIDPMNFGGMGHPPKVIYPLNQ